MLPNHSGMAEKSPEELRHELVAAEQAAKHWRAVAERKGANSVSGMPTWARVASMLGVPAVIAFYLLGMIPGMPSPFADIRNDLKAAAAALERHDQNTRESLRIFRLVCAGVWKDQPAVARNCYNGGEGHK